VAATSISNMSVGAGQVGQQKAGAAREHAQEKGAGLAPEGNPAGKPVDDTVSLHQSGKAAGQARMLDAQGVEEVMPRAKAAILANGRTAVAAQANVNARAAREMLADR